MSRISAAQLRDTILDPGSFVSWDLTPVDTGPSPQYAAELAAAREKTGLDESVLTGAATVLGASCAADPDETLAPAPAAEKQAAPPPAGDASAGALERAFSALAPRVLGRGGASAFLAADGGFARSVAPSRLASLDVKLPADAADPARITAPGGFEIRVRELGAEGEGALAERAVRYRRAGGSAFWTVSEGGAEEWLHLAAGTVRSKDEVAVAWEIEGASLVAMNGAVALMDAEGRARAWVTAPEAWSADGRPIALRLGARGQRLELFADAQGEELLIDPGWVAVAPCGTGRLGSTANTLAGGKVLLAGGVTGATIASNAELYDPVTNTWSAAGNMAAGRYLGASALLASGRVLVLGGQTLAGYPATTEQYNPATNTWSASASMSGPRGNATAIVLASGKVLAAGGYSGVSFLASAEIYDPVANTWTALPDMPGGRDHLVARHRRAQQRPLVGAPAGASAEGDRGLGRHQHVEVLHHLGRAGREAEPGDGAVGRQLDAGMGTFPHLRLGEGGQVAPRADLRLQRQRLDLREHLHRGEPRVPHAARVCLRRVSAGFPPTATAWLRWAPGESRRRGAGRRSCVAGRSRRR